MALHLLLEGSLGPLTPRQQDMVATARDDAERLLRILNDLLDLARLDEGATALHREVVTAEALVQEVVVDFAETVASAGLNLTTDVDSNLPRISVDVPRIRHVFANLISNAIKHSPPARQIVLRASHAADDHLEFSVHDDGPGIAPEFHARIFERFFRVPGQTKGGVGLGLSICREIVLAHGGCLGVRSPPNQGCELYFALPSADHRPAVESPSLREPLPAGIG